MLKILKIAKYKRLWGKHSDMHKIKLKNNVKNIYWIRTEMIVNIKIKNYQNLNEFDSQHLVMIHKWF